MSKTIHILICKILQVIIQCPLLAEGGVSGPSPKGFLLTSSGEGSAWTLSIWYG